MMKRTFASILAAVALLAPATGWSAKTVPYASDLGINYALDQDWEQAYRSEKYWEYDRNSNFSTPGTAGGMMHTYEPIGVTADAILMSPAITVTAGTTYTVGFWASTANASSGEVEAFKLFKGTERTIDALKATEPLINVDNYLNNIDFEKFSAKFTAETSEDLYFGIYCCSEPYQGTLNVTGFFIYEGEGDDMPEEPDVEVEIPYTADFSTADGFKEWSSLAGPEAETTAKWSYNAWAGYPEFDRSEGLKEDNYFISPALNFTQAGPYIIDFEYTAYGSFDLVLGTDSKDPASFNKVLFSVDDVTDFDVTAHTDLTIDEPGKYFVALHVRAEAGSYMGYRLHSFKVKSNLPVPSLVTDLKAVSAPNDALSVELSWTNPALSHIGTPLDMITQIEVMRNGSLIATLADNLTPGAAASYTDTPDEAGNYTYSLIVYGTNGSYDGEPAQANAGYVGRPTAEFPYSVNTSYASDDTLMMFTTLDADNDGTDWAPKTEWYSTYFTSANNTAEDAADTADNYLASPYIHLVPGYYLFTSSISSRCNTFEVGIATDRHHLAETFVKYGGISDQQDYGFNDYSVVVPIDEEGDYCLVWHHVGISTHYAYPSISLQSATLDTQALLPDIAADLAASAQTGQLEVTLTWTNPALDNAARPLTAISKAEVLRDGTVIATIAEDLTPGEETSYTDTVEDSGEYTYSVVIYNENGCADTEAPAVTLFVGTGREIPYTADFNEWIIVDKGSYQAWAVGADGSAYFTRGYFDDVEYNDGIYSPYILLEEGKRYIATFTTYGTDDDQEGTFTLQAGLSRDGATDLREFSHTGKAQNTHTIKLQPLSEAIQTDDDDDDEGIIIPAGNVVVGFHIFENADVYIRDFKIEQDFSYTSITAAAASAAAMTLNNGIITFAEGMTDVAVADITGRVLFTSASAPASLDLHNFASNSILFVKATTADGTPATLKVRL